MAKPDKPTDQQQPPAQGAKPADAKCTTAEIRALVDKHFGPHYTVLAVGQESVIVHSGDPKTAGIRVPLK